MGKHNKAETIHENEPRRFIESTRVRDQAGNAVIVMFWAVDSGYEIELGIENEDGLLGDVHSFGLKRGDLIKLGSLLLEAARVS
jgi:hypothetical protein